MMRESEASEVIEPQNESRQSSQIQSGVDKSGLSRQSHYTVGSKNPYEGGSRRGGNGGGNGNKDGQNAINLFKNNDPLS